MQGVSTPLFFFLRFYSFIHERQTEREREREAETQAEGEAGSMQGAQHGTRSQVSRITPRAAGGTKPLCHWGCPKWWDLNHVNFKAAGTYFVSCGLENRKLASSQREIHSRSWERRPPQISQECCRDQIGSWLWKPYRSKICPININLLGGGN